MIATGQPRQLCTWVDYCTKPGPTPVSRTMKPSGRTMSEWVCEDHAGAARRAGFQPIQDRQEAGGG